MVNVTARQRKLLMNNAEFAAWCWADYSAWSLIPLGALSARRDGLLYALGPAA